MKYITYGFKSMDNINLICQKWISENEKALICLIHGLGEHGGCYREMAEFMTKKGYSLAALDLRGHGHSDGKRGHTGSFDYLMQDIDVFINEVLNETPKVPCFLYGHSMGGNLVLNYCLRYKPGFNGVITTGPWLRLAFELPKYKLLLAGLMNLVFPSFAQNNGLGGINMSHENGSDSECSEDPLVHNLISARLFHCIHDSGLWALEHAGEFKLPLLIMHGSDDRVTSLKASLEFADAADRCTMKVWEGLYHVLQNEPQHDEVFQYAADWMEMHL